MERPPFEPLFADATASPYRDLYVQSKTGYLVFLSPGLTALSSVANSVRSGGNVVIAPFFAVGFRSEGGETAPFRTPTDFSFSPALSAARATQRRVQKDKNRGAVALLESWLNAGGESEAEQRETLEYLIKALDEDRPSNRKLFP